MREAENRDYDDEREDDELEEDDANLEEDDVIESELEEADLIEEWCPNCKDIKPHQVLHDGTHHIICAECNHEHKREKNNQEATPVIYGILTPEEKADSTLRAEAWQRLTSEVPQSEIKPYSIHADFEEGDVINHVKFGRGVVIEKLEKTKVEILFADDLKRLVCNK